MEKIEGLDFSKLIQEQAEDIRSEQVKVIQRKVRWVLQSLRAAEQEKRRAQKEVEKADKAINDAKEKLKRIEAGDWNIINAINADKKLAEIPEENRANNVTV